MRTGNRSTVRYANGEDNETLTCCGRSGYLPWLSAASPLCSCHLPFRLASCYDTDRSLLASLLLDGTIGRECVIVPNAYGSVMHVK